MMGVESQKVRKSESQKVEGQKVDETSRGRDEEGLRRALRLNVEFRIVNSELAAQHILCYKSYRTHKTYKPNPSKIRKFVRFVV